MNKKLVFLFVILGLITIPLMADSCSHTNNADTQQTQQQNQNTNAADRLHKLHPYPPTTDSQELANQVEWYKRLQDPNKIAYIYLITRDGSVFAVYQIRAKCSSTNSQYSAPQTVVNGGAITGSSTFTPVVIDAPQPDGSYGQNEQAVFCFLNDSHRTMIEFSEQWQYIWSETPLNLTSAPTIVVIPNGK